MKMKFNEALEDCPIITAIKDWEGLDRCLESESRIVFVLFGDVCNISAIVHKLKAGGKLPLVHMDLITGLSTKEITVDFIRRYTEADGIITTKQALIKRAKELGLFTVLRFFVIDSLAIDNIKKQTEAAKPDLIEILPGVMPKVIKRICDMVSIPVIAGGLIADKEDIIAALSAGAVSISTTNQTMWFM